MAILEGIRSIEDTLCISEVSVNMYGISFKIEEFMSRAIEERPWSIMGCCMVPQWWYRRDVVKDVKFIKLAL